MTREEAKKLTDEELWAYVWFAAGKPSPIAGAYPNYPSDLNACREMGDTLVGQRQESFLYILSIIVGEGTPDYKWRFINATARQRCEAFVCVTTENK